MRPSDSVGRNFSQSNSLAGCDKVHPHSSKEAAMSTKTQVGISAVARAVGVSEGEIRRLANDGTIQSSRDHANRRVFDVGVIDVLKARAARIEAKRRAKTPA
jgi:hypothetical protein